MKPKEVVKPKEPVKKPEKTEAEKAAEAKRLAEEKTERERKAAEEAARKRVSGAFGKGAQMTGNKGTAAKVAREPKVARRVTLLPERRPEPEVMEHLTLADVL